MSDLDKLHDVTLAIMGKAKQANQLISYYEAMRLAIEWGRNNILSKITDEKHTFKIHTEKR